MSVTADNMEGIIDAPVIAVAPPKLTLWQRLNLSMEHIVLALFTVAVVVGPQNLHQVAVVALVVVEQELLLQVTPTTAQSIQAVVVVELVRAKQAHQAVAVL